MPRPRIYLLILIAILLAAGGAALYFVSFRPAGDTVRLVTNVPEIAVYAEVYNASHSQEYRVEVIYLEQPVEGLSHEYQADLIIGNFLNNEEHLTSFRPLDSLFTKRDFDTGVFYQKALKEGFHEESQYLVPLAFDLMLAAFSPEQAKDVQSIMLSYKEIRSRSAEFKREGEEHITRMGFSPLWKQEHLFHTVRLKGVDFVDTAGQGVRWDENKLEQALSEIRNECENIHRDPATVRDFTDRYLYDPSYKLLRQGRILFDWWRSDDFFELPDQYRRDLDFRWIHSEDTIPVLEDVLFMGLTRNGDAPKAAEDFFFWLLKPETQTLLMEDSRSKQLKSFGFAGGFSSLRLVNEQVFPRLYPYMVGHIPPERNLDFPAQLPAYWEKLKENAVLPWLKDYFFQGNTAGLSDRVSTWMRQNPQ
ncbi:MAG: hypothetical protein K9L68_07650 [Spirochaetales bacterium]|nr:hypothetical protein [Spirochaetales bacterium]MCF7938456.1 hypothetical protein [Spirochaetales bacterium]